MAKTIKAWGGFVDGKLDETREVDWAGAGESGRMFAIYTTRADARSAYQDVRRVEIRVLPRAKGKNDG